MGLISLLFKDPIAFIILVIPLLYSIIFHEIAHGWVAYLFGDKTAKWAGRLSLNPVVHIDPIGTLLLFIFGFGWAKPVPVNYNNLKNLRIGLICVSLAGCLVNILIATVSLFLIQTVFKGNNGFIPSVLFVVARINIILGALNLIPIPPLDGSKILMGFLPYRAQISFAQLEPYGLIILFVLIATGLLNPIIIFMQKIVLVFIKLILGV